MHSFILTMNKVKLNRNSNVAYSMLLITDAGCELLILSLKLVNGMTNKIHTQPADRNYKNII